MCYTFREYTKTRQAPPAGERSPGARRKEVMSVTNILLVCAVLLPLLGGALLPLLPTGNRKGLHGTVLALLILEAGVVTALLLRPEAEFFLFAMTDSLTVSLRMDGISKLFLAVGAYGFLITGVYAFRYLEPGGREKSFFAFFLLALGALAGMDLAANLTTMYLFFELLTLCSMPMVLHDRTQESIRAALKYLFYSMAGAFLALCTIFVLSRFCGSLSFTPAAAWTPPKSRAMRPCCGWWSSWAWWASAPRRASTPSTAGCPRPIRWPRRLPPPSCPASSPRPASWPSCG